MIPPAVERSRSILASGPCEPPRLPYRHGSFTAEHTPRRTHGARSRLPQCLAPAGRRGPIGRRQGVAVPAPARQRGLPGVPRVPGLAVAPGARRCGRRPPRSGGRGAGECGRVGGGGAALRLARPGPAPGEGMLLLGRVPGAARDFPWSGTQTPCAQRLPGRGGRGYLPASGFDGGAGPGRRCDGVRKGR